MPELPEVETIVRGLRVLVGQRIDTVVALDPTALAGSLSTLAGAGLVGRRVQSVTRRGKVIVIATDGDCVLSVHLRMTGQLIYFAANTSLPPRFTRVRIQLASGDLYFADARRFGKCTIGTIDEFTHDAFLNRLGPDAWTVDAGDVASVLRRHPRSKVKAVLLDQSSLAGVGNIYADEALWHAGIHPETLCGVLDEYDAAVLATSVRHVLSRGVARGGSSLRDYVDASGQRGSYLDEAVVFARTGQPCGRCHTPISKIRVAGRGTHLCEHCQVRKVLT